MLDEGVYFAPATFEAGVVPARHDAAAPAAAAARKVFATMAARPAWPARAPPHRTARPDR